MKEDVYMSNNAVVKRNLDELKKRAYKRNISFSSKPKSEDDTRVENDFFKTIENQILPLCREE